MNDNILKLWIRNFNYTRKKEIRILQKNILFYKFLQDSTRKSDPYILLFTATTNHSTIRNLLESRRIRRTHVRAWWQVQLRASTSTSTRVDRKRPRGGEGVFESKFDPSRNLLAGCCAARFPFPTGGSLFPLLFRPRVTMRSARDEMRRTAASRHAYHFGIMQLAENTPYYATSKAHGSYQGFVFRGGATRATCNAMQQDYDFRVSIMISIDARFSVGQNIVEIGNTYGYGILRET